MANLPIDEIEKMIGSRYALTVLAGKRARELRDGAPRLVNSDSNNPIMIALQEIHEGKIFPENLDYSAGQERAPQGETAAEKLAGLAQESVLPEGPAPGMPAGVSEEDLPELTDALAAGGPKPGTVDVTGSVVDESTAEYVPDELDLHLEEEDEEPLEELEADIEPGLGTDTDESYGG